MLAAVIAHVMNLPQVGIGQLSQMRQLGPRQRGITVAQPGRPTPRRKVEQVPKP